MNNDNFVKSTETLKETVPLMIKHKVPTTPANYALWYTYVTQQSPRLNQAIDGEIAEQGQCSPTACDKLYQQHIASKTVKDMAQLKQSLTAMMQELSHSMTDTLSETESFQHNLNKGFNQLELAEKEGLSLEETMGLVRNLVKESRNIQLSAGAFRTQLNSAQQEIAALRAALHESQKEANEDALTGILNRRAFDRDMESFQLKKQPYSLIMLDIDRFKRFNDDFGHQMGDQVIKAVARRLKESCREQMQAYRFGGEEFALVLPNRSLASARQHAETLRRNIEKIAVMDRKKGERVNSITASFGLAEQQPQEPVIDVIRRADEFLNQAKKLGRNRVLPVN
ncbi:diguanylate cyclase [Photobacterium jeanii]|uniref:diguanylate cyclase n=1 Tax=Photobacterium jeanii TaxID=858640 RepID=A0A178KP81_9GAMM|nr:GGDEF domain-containing protein [Photobacterium jeanii]OAN18483.1 diguanylate cyclase [Photobacterium jeanii]PST91835.1 GGDEF domain-containing protein [Photobacterium jeanii]